MKKLIYLIPLLMGLALTSCYKDDIRGLQNQINKLKSTQIASLQEQINAIKATLPKLEQTDRELDGYIESLQTTATNLQNSINETNAKIDEVKNSLQEECSTAKAQILAELSAMQSEMETELEKIDSTIRSLQAMDVALDAKVEELKQYVDNELVENRNWVNATFATLEQYSEIASDIAIIKLSIITLNNNLEALEQRLSETIITEIAEALEPIKDELVVSVISEIADAYMAAINEAKSDITASYTDAIAASISTLEQSMMLWVCDQLKGYYTIAEVEGKLVAMQNIISSNDLALAADIEALIEALAEAKAETTAAYEQAIADAINTNNGVVDSKIAIAIAEANVHIENEIKAINAKIDAIENRLTKVEGDIATIGEQIANINDAIAALENADDQLAGYIESLQTTATNLQEAINDTNSQIDRLETAMEEEILAAKADVLAQLESLRGELEVQLEQINNAIKTLQAKDVELDQKIALLQDYVDNELSNNRDWASATFATLEQYYSLVDDIAIVMSYIQEINSNIEELETRISSKIKNDIAAATATLDADIKEQVSKITNAYTSAISEAKNEITAAYANAIAEAIYNLEISLKSWVSEQLQGYYTIAQVEAKLAILQETIEEGDSELLETINALTESLAQLKKDVTSEYISAIESAIESNNGVIDGKIATAVSTVNTRISSEIVDINEQIVAIESRLNKIESDIASIKEQIVNINNTIGALQNADERLTSYIENLQTIATNLQNAINQTNAQIEGLETAFEGAISTAKADILAQLASLRTEMITELEQVNGTIATLQTKDAELENKISTLQSYVDNELANNKNWANATFATLAQYNSLASDVAGINEQIDAITASISSLESRLTSKISNDISAALSNLDGTIQQRVTEITDAYTAAISNAKRDITAAYTDAIAEAISVLDTSMKSWVSEQLKGYYTISEIEAKLEALESELNGRLNAQKAYLEGLVSSLSAELVDLISDNSDMIESLRNDIQNLQNSSDSEAANNIAQNSAAIATNTQAIMSNAAAISANASEVESIKTTISDYKEEMATKIAVIESRLTSINADITAIYNEIEAVSDEYNSKITALQNSVDKKIEDNKSLIQANQTLINKNAEAIAANKSAIEQLKTSVNAAIAKNASDIANNAENIANNAALVAQNAQAISNNTNAIAQNSADILQLQQDLISMKGEITEEYNTAIATAIAALNGSLSGEIASQIAIVNYRIDNEVATINSTIATLSSRVSALEIEVNSIKQQIADILTEIADMKQDIANLMNRIQSVTYIPKYSGGKACVKDGVVELDFQISPKDAVNAIAANWQSVLSVKAVYTITRAVSFIDMPIVSFEADQTNGIITIVASADNMSEAFFTGNQSASISLTISDGNNCVTSAYIPTMPYHPLNEIWYTTSNHAIIEPVTECDFGANIISNTYHDGKGIIKFDGDVTHIICEKNTSYGNPYYDSVFESSVKYRLTSIKFPDSVTMIAPNAFYNHLNLAKIDIGGGLISLGNSFTMGSVSDTMVTVYCRAQTPPIIEQPNSSTFSNLSVIYVPKDSVNVYKTADGWKNYADKIVPYDFEKGEVVQGNNQILAKIDIPDLALKNNLVDTYDDNGNNEIDIVEAENITMVNCSGKGVADLTGLESCTNLVTLDCSNNNITKIELPNLAQLETVTCNDCPIEIMNFNGCTSLQYLYLQDATTNAIIGNKLKVTNYNQAASLSIDVSNTTLEQIFVCRSEILTHLDVSKNTNLKSLEAYVNPILKSIDVSTLVNLEILDLGDCDLTNLDVSKNLMLTELYVTNNKLSTIDVSQNKQLKVLKCKGNQISNLNVSNNDKLETLIVEDNKLSAINVSNNTALTYLNINNNADISKVDVQYNTSLKELYCNGLAIGDLNIVNNTALTKLECNSNPNLTTLTCNNAFDFTTTHISINKGLKIISANGSVLTPSVGDLITVNLGTGVVVSASDSCMLVSVSETSTRWYDAKTWCSDYGTDWYFPSLNSLKSIYKNKSTINSTLSANGFTTLGTKYWSSTDDIGDEAVDSRYYAYMLNFSDGYSSSGSKNGSGKVRAVLSF